MVLAASEFKFFLAIRLTPYSVDATSAVALRDVRYELLSNIIAEQRAYFRWIVDD